MNGTVQRPGCPAQQRPSACWGPFFACDMNCDILPRNCMCPNLCQHRCVTSARQLPSMCLARPESACMIPTGLRAGQQPAGPHRTPQCTCYQADLSVFGGRRSPHARGLAAAAHLCRHRRRRILRLLRASCRPAFCELCCSRFCRRRRVGRQRRRRLGLRAGVARRRFGSGARAQHRCAQPPLQRAPLLLRQTSGLLSMTTPKHPGTAARSRPCSVRRSSCKRRLTATDVWLS